MKRTYYLFIFVPSLIGFIYNNTIMQIIKLPFLGSFIIYVLPFAMIFFWGWVGLKYARIKIPAACAVLLGNSVGILSFLLYIWQFIFLSDERRNFFLAGISQFFTSPTSLLTARTAAIFVPQGNVIGPDTAFVMQIIGLIVMILTFIVGFYYGKIKLRQANI